MQAAANGPCASPHCEPSSVALATNASRPRGSSRLLPLPWLPLDGVCGPCWATPHNAQATGCRACSWPAESARRLSLEYQSMSKHVHTSHAPCLFCDCVDRPYVGIADSRLKREKIFVQLNHNRTDNDRTAVHGSRYTAVLQYCTLRT